MLNIKEETMKVKKSFDGDRKRKERGSLRAERENRSKGMDIEKDIFYRVTLKDGRIGTGRIVSTQEKMIKLIDFTYEKEGKVYPEHTIKMEEIKHLDSFITSLEKDVKKDGIVVVVFVTGSLGYGELINETEETVTLAGFTLFVDSSMSYEETKISKNFIKEILKLERKNSQVAPEKKEKDFLLDHEIRNKKETGSSTRMEPFFASGSPKETFIFEEDNTNEKWDQFKANEMKFGIVATFDESVYTTVLDRNSKEYKKHEKSAELLARKIDGLSSSSNLHMEEERGRISRASEDSKYGSAGAQLKRDNYRKKRDYKISPTHTPSAFTREKSYHFQSQSQSEKYSGKAQQEEKQIVSPVKKNISLGNSNSVVVSPSALIPENPVESLSSKVFKNGKDKVIYKKSTNGRRILVSVTSDKTDKTDKNLKKAKPVQNSYSSSSPNTKPYNHNHHHSNTHYNTNNNNNSNSNSNNSNNSKNEEHTQHTQSKDIKQTPKKEAVASTSSSIQDRLNVNAPKFDPLMAKRPEYYIKTSERDKKNAGQQSNERKNSSDDIKEVEREPSPIAETRNTSSDNGTSTAATTTTIATTAETTTATAAANAAQKRNKNPKKENKKENKSKKFLWGKGKSIFSDYI